MRFAYADPPYPGMANLYPEKQEVDHARLIAELEADYDGWALSTHVPGLRVVVPLLPERARICAWVKPFASFKPGALLQYAWEPVIVAPVRKPTQSVPDWCSAGITLMRGMVGAKPADLAYWIFAAAGLEPDDELVDLYPGSGAVGRAWAQWRGQLRLPLRIARSEERRRNRKLELVVPERTA